MHFNGVFASLLYTSAVFLGSVRAQDDIDDGAEASSTSLSESSTAVPVEKPTFTVSIGAGSFTFRYHCLDLSV